MNKISYNDDSVAFDAGMLAMQIASLNYEADMRYLKTIFSNLVRIVHGKDTDYHIGPPEQMFGWNFFILSIKRKTVHQLTKLLGTEILKERGGSIDQKFVSWVKRKYGIEKKSNLNMVLLSDLKSSEFGLF